MLWILVEEIAITQTSIFVIGTLFVTLEKVVSHSVGGLTSPFLIITQIWLMLSLIHDK